VHQQRRAEANTGASQLAPPSNNRAMSTPQLRDERPLPVVRPPDVSHPDLAMTRFFSAHRPLLDMELLPPSRQSMPGSGTGSSRSLVEPKGEDAAEATASTAATVFALSSGPATAADQDAASGRAASSSASVEVPSTAEEPVPTSSTPSPSHMAMHPGIQRTKIVIDGDTRGSIKDMVLKAFAAAVEQADPSSPSPSALAVISLQPREQQHTVAHFRSGASERSIVLPNSLWRRKPKQPISTEQFNQLVDELSSLTEDQSASAAPEQHLKGLHRGRVSQGSAASIDISAAARSLALVQGRQVAQASTAASSAPRLPSSPDSRTAARRNPSTKVLGAAIKLMAHDAFVTSRDLAVSRAIERGENPTLAQRLGVESELVILGEQAGPKKEWARGVALWLAEHGRAYLPPPAPVPANASSQTDRPWSRPMASKLKGKHRPADVDVVISDPDTFVNISLMDAENSFSHESTADEWEDFDSFEAESSGVAELQADLPPADPNMLLSHALVQARLAESLQSANALTLIDSALKRLSGPALPENREDTDFKTLLLDIASLNANLADIRSSALRSKADQARAAKQNARSTSSSARSSASGQSALHHFAVQSTSRGRHTSRRRRGASVASIYISRSGSSELNVEARLPSLNRAAAEAGDNHGAGVGTETDGDGDVNVDANAGRRLRMSALNKLQRARARARKGRQQAQERKS